jgi:hypothetical protein
MAPTGILQRFPYRLVQAVYPNVLGVNRSVIARSCETRQPIYSELHRNRSSTFTLLYAGIKFAVQDLRVSLDRGCSYDGYLSAGLALHPRTYYPHARENRMKGARGGIRSHVASASKQSSHRPQMSMRYCSEAIYFLASARPTFFTMLPNIIPIIYSQHRAPRCVVGF